MSTIDDLERLAALHSQGALSDFEFEHQKRELMHGEPRNDGSSGFGGHAAACVIGSIVLTFLCGSIAEQTFISSDDVDFLLGLCVLFSVWLVPHTVWLLMQRGSFPSTKLLPLVALLFVGISWAVYADTHVTSAKDVFRSEMNKLSGVLRDLSGK